MASDLRINNLEDKVNKLMKVVKNGHLLQEEMGRRQFQLENKIERIMETIIQGAQKQQGEVNTSFIEDHVSPPIDGDIAGDADIINQVPLPVVNDGWTRNDLKLMKGGWIII